MKVTDRLSTEDLAEYDAGYSVFDVGSYSIFVSDRTVDRIVVLLVLVAAVLATYLVATGLAYAVSRVWPLWMGASVVSTAALPPL